MRISALMEGGGEAANAEPVTAADDGVWSFAIDGMEPRTGCAPVSPRYECDASLSTLTGQMAAGARLARAFALSESAVLLLDDPASKWRKVVVMLHSPMTGPHALAPRLPPRGINLPC